MSSARRRASIFVRAVDGRRTHTSLWSRYFTYRRVPRQTMEAMMHLEEEIVGR
jgi:hypothetical protein